MGDKKIDRRTRKTKAALTQALIILLSEKKLNKITVKGITDLADVNRSTFYLYYDDIFDMAEKLEAEMLNEFREAFQKISWENKYESLLDFTTYIFEYVQSNAEMYKILLSANGNHAYVRKLKDIINQSRLPVTGLFTEKEIYYYMPFIISGCMGAMEQWLNDNMITPPKEMAAFIMKML